MAALEVTKKLLVYHTLYRLNLSFSNIVTRIRELRDIGVLSAHSNKLFQGYTQELQAEINQELLEIMHAIELEDWGRFGRIRQAEEKRIQDPDDVFIHAEERRKELAQKRKKKNDPATKCSSEGFAGHVKSRLNLPYFYPGTLRRPFLCAEHVRQLGGESPLHNLMEVK
jgi:hypothetical protein